MQTPTTTVPATSEELVAEAREIVKEARNTRELRDHLLAVQAAIAHHDVVEPNHRAIVHLSLVSYVIEQEIAKRETIVAVLG